MSTAIDLVSHESGSRDTTRTGCCRRSMTHLLFLLIDRKYELSLASFFLTNGGPHSRVSSPVPGTSTCTVNQHSCTYYLSDARYLHYIRSPVSQKHGAEGAGEHTRQVKYFNAPQRRGCSGHSNDAVSLKMKKRSSLTIRILFARRFCCGAACSGFAFFPLRARQRICRAPAPLSSSTAAAAAVALLTSQNLKFSNFSCITHDHSVVMSASIPMRACAKARGTAASAQPAGLKLA